MRKGEDRISEGNGFIMSLLKERPGFVGILQTGSSKSSCPACHFSLLPVTVSISCSHSSREEQKAREALGGPTRLQPLEGLALGPQTLAVKLCSATS